MALRDDLEAARHVGTMPVSEPPKTYPADASRSDRAPAVTLPTMQNSEMRNRLSQLQSPRVVDQNEESATSSGVEMTPTSSEGSEQGQEASRSLSWSSAKLHDLFRSSTAALSFRSKEDVELFKQKHGYNQIIHEKVDVFPKGFPRLAALVSSDDDLTIFRGFKRLHARILLQLEVEISQLEESLDELDKKDYADPAMRYRLTKTKHEKDWDPTQRHLLDQLREKLKEYDECFLKNSLIQGHGRPPKRNYESFFNWAYTKQELSPGYRNFIFHEDDFISGIGGTDSSRRSESNYFGECILSHLTTWPNSPLKMLVKSEPTVYRPGEPIVDRYSSAKLSVFSKMLLVFLAVAMLLAPVFLLFLISMTRLKMAMTVFAFVLLFAGVMCGTTDAKMQEVLVGTAAYGAFLVTFLGNLNGNQSCGASTA